MRECTFVQLSWEAFNSNLYPPSMKGKMLVFKVPRNLGPFAKIEVLCDDNNVRVADARDLVEV